MLDIAAQTGWAAGRGGQYLRSGTVNFTGTRTEKAVQFRKWLEVQPIFKAADVIAFERPFCRGMAATRALWGMAGIIEAMADGAVLDVTSMAVKGFLGVAGKKSKDQKAAVMAAIRARGYNPATQDEADAIALLLYMMEKAR